MGAVEMGRVGGLAHLWREPTTRMAAPPFAVFERWVPPHSGAHSQFSPPLLIKQHRPVGWPTFGVNLSQNRLPLDKSEGVVKAQLSWATVPHFSRFLREVGLLCSSITYWNTALDYPPHVPSGLKRFYGSGHLPTFPHSRLPRLNVRVSPEKIGGVVLVLKGD